jgi:hypothetical protein
MLCLPYHNPIRHLIIDQMHCLFLGIAHWIVKRLWIDGGKISKANLKLMEKRAKAIKVPVDLGRVPCKIAAREGFSNQSVQTYSNWFRNLWISKYASIFKEFIHPG